MHIDHANFIVGINVKRKIILTFHSKEDDSTLLRTCAPMDYGPLRRITNDLTNRYHFWDYDSDVKRHPLSLKTDQIVRIELTDEYFDPSEFISWNLIKSPWFLKRDWGRWS